MKKTLIFLITYGILTIASLILILFLGLITSCRTTTEIQTVLPPLPQRKPIECTEWNETEILETLNYYEHLVQEWEAWADYVKTKENIIIIGE
jgi:ABC-type protease/lipase transport system fused ATPase/permease subunit